MTTYNEIAGRRVNFLSSDPTYVDTNSDGQVWYNSSTATLKSWLPTGAWSSGGALNTSRAETAGSGTQTAALGFGGTTGSLTAVTEAYNGIAWTNKNSMSTARRLLAGEGTQTAALAFGGYAGPGNGTAASNATEAFNGTSWTAGGNLNTARYGLGGAGIQTAGLAFGGETGPGIATEKYNGSTWTSVNNMNTARVYFAGTGIQTAALAAGAGPTGTNTESYNGTTWTTVNSMNTARSGLAGSGTQTATVIFGGNTPAPAVTSATELWNGTSWNSSPTGLATARSYLGSAGTQSNALGFAGGPAGNISTATEEWNFGVYSYSAAAWASGGNFINSRTDLDASGTQTAALGFGGYNPPNAVPLTSASDNATDDVVVISESQMTKVGAAHAADDTRSTNGKLTYKYIVGQNEGSYSNSINLPQVNANNAAGTTGAVTAGFTIKASTSVVSNADVLKSIVALIASINKQIQALQKLILKR